MPATTNLHELGRRSTREALRRVALARFAGKGFANVTVAELAEEAGVTQRTFFRHFPTKEAVLFQDYETHLDWLPRAAAVGSVSVSLLRAGVALVLSFTH